MQRGYKLVWMLVLDVAKLGSYRHMEHRAAFKQRFLVRANQPLR